MNDILKVTWRVTYICKHIPCTSQLAVKGHIDTLHKNNDNVKPTKSSFHCYKKHEMWIALIDLLLSFSTCSYCIGNNDICFLTSRFRGFKGLLPSFLSNMRSANDPKPMQSKFNLTHSCHIKNKNNNKQETHMVYDLNYARFEKCLRWF